MWVARLRAGDPRRPQIGQVCDVHEDGSLNIVLYASDGSRVGRSSPPCGGPTRYEPCCNPEPWVPIEKPNFKRLGAEIFFGLHLRRLAPDTVGMEKHEQ